MRILIVEDEARIRAFLARAFEAEGFTVDVVGTATADSRVRWPTPTTW